MDRFQVKVIQATPNPQQVIYAALHQDYCEDFVWDVSQFPPEEKCGEIIVKQLLAGERGHYGPLEHPQITFACGYFPHSVMQQARTHRVGTSFDVQCLAADTEITFVNCENTSSSQLKKTIGELYDLWTNGEKAVRQRFIRGRKGELPGEYRRDAKKRIRKMRLRVLNEKTGFFETSHIKDVTCSGIQPVYRVTLEDDKYLDCTVNHRLFTLDGWQTMGEATGLITTSNHEVVAMARECAIMCNGIVRSDALYTSKVWLQEQASKGLTASQIAISCGSQSQAIRKWAKYYQIDLRSGYASGKKEIVGNGTYRDKNWLEDRLEEGLYTDEIAQLAGCSIEAVKKWVYKYGLSLNKRKPGLKEPWNKDRKGYTLNLSDEKRRERSERSRQTTKRGEKSNFWKGGTSSERMLIGAWTRQISPQVHKKFNYICQKCGVRGGTLHAHHLIPVYANESLAYDFNNLVSLCKDCHEYIHQNHQEAEFAELYMPILEPKNWQPKPKPPGNKLKAHPIKVVKVEYLGMQMTYDLEVEDPWHNFVANSMVVHNSGRYTGIRVIEAAEGKRDIEDVFYLRPVGNYSDRQGKKYHYSEAQRQTDRAWCLEATKRYQADIAAGMAEEHARGKLPFDYRQHFIVSFNVRSLMHFLDLRGKRDAQLEIQQLCEHMLPHFETWVPAIAEWYRLTRLGKARLAP